MPKVIGTLRKSAPLAAPILLCACNQQQSTFAPFGEDAAQIGSLTLIMVIGAVIIAVAMAALMVWAVRAPEGRLTLRGGELLILVAGGVLPTIVLLALLAYSLPSMRPRPVAAADLKIEVAGEQFWWRVRYTPPGAAPVVTANEVRVPLGRTVQFRLTGRDVIHSFWIPGLAGKIDMIPGRENLLVVRATRTGRFRGQCTEFCGLSHALMAFDVVVMEPAAFDTWLARERLAAQGANGPGRALFASYGCGGCHSIRGTDQAGTIGPDLTHMGSRHTIAAGMLAPTETNVARFIRHPERTKPGVRMPAFGHMPEAESRTIARYLRTLQ